MDFITRMTNKMRSCLLSEEEIETEIRLCYAKFRKTYEQSNVSLPLENEDGLPVVHGSRVVVGYVHEYWRDRLSSITSLGRSFLSRNKQIELELELRGLSFIRYPAKYIDL